MIRRLLALSAIAGAVVTGGAGAQAGSPSGQHYVYECPGYSYDANSHTYTLPKDCHSDAYANPATHTWLTNRVPAILHGDGRNRQADLLNTKISVGSRGRGRTNLDSLRDGVIAADFSFQGCNAAGRKAGWPVGDHMLNPYRNFGYWSYADWDQAWGWRGVGYMNSAPRRLGACGIGSSVRTNAARMADEFFARAFYQWRHHQPGEGMFNLGIALHLVEDVSVPSHAHPEMDVTWIGKQDVFPAWATVNKQAHTVSDGGRYLVDGWTNGVRTVSTPGGFVYAMAAESFPYFPYNASTAARVPGGCDVTTDPEACPSESDGLLHMAQRYSAGFTGYFFDRLGYRG